MSDLPIEMCAHCRGNTTAPEEEKPDYKNGQTTTAKYPGVCKGGQCIHAPILPGMTIIYSTVKNAWLCEECWSPV